MKHFNRLLAIVILLCISEYGFTQIPEFTRIDTGIVHNHISAHYAAGWVDIDQDGDMDLVIANAGMNVRNRPVLLYRNERNNLFRQIQDEDYTKRRRWTAFPGPFGDIDNDGDEDVVLCGFDETTNYVYKNDGYGNLTLSTSYASPNSWASQFLFDLNNDSFLDLVLIAQDGFVFYNDGSGSFVPSKTLNIMEAEEEILHSTSWGDVDDDGDMDLFCGYSYFAGDPFPGMNALYLNNGEGDFEKFADPLSVFADSAMTGSANWIDFDNDGDMDLFVLNSMEYRNEESMLSRIYINNRNLQFEKYIFEPDIYKDSHKVSSSWGDIDNDGDLDLYISIEKNDFGSGGHVSPTKFNLLFENQGNGQLMEITDHPLVNESSHGITFTDHDNDGDLDALLIRYSWSKYGRNNLFINEGNSNSWINIKCTGTHSNRSAFGTRITAKAIIGGIPVTQTREISPMHGHYTYPSTRVHFGLGDAKVIDSLIIRWPLSHVDTFLNVQANQFYQAIEDSILEIDFRATNYVQLSPGLAEIRLTEVGELLSIDLSTHYQFVKGDSVPDISGDTLSFTLHSNENPDVVVASIDPGTNILSLEAGTEEGISLIQIISSAGFTSRMDQFQVTYLTALPELSLAKDTVDLGDSIVATSTKDGMIFLVNEGTPADLSGILAFFALKDSSIATANVQVEFPTVGLRVKDYWLYAVDTYGFISKPDTVTIAPGTGVEKSTTAGISVYPNPSNTLITIETDYPHHYSIEITALNGQQILLGEMKGSTHQIDLSSFQKGVYFITIRSKDTVTTRKIIKL